MVYFLKLIGSRPGLNTLKSIRIRILSKCTNTNMNTSNPKVFEYEYKYFLKSIQIHL